MSVTERLHKFMESEGLSKADIARLSGIPYTTIDGLFKKGDENTKLSTLKKLAALLNCSLDELTEDSSDPTPTYYLDPEAGQMAQEIYDNPGMRILFDAAKDVSAGDLKTVADLVAKMRKKENGEDD
ncbi:MAG: helix-turn-helix transcriptional regulator [Acidaminococcaceae bacterium]